MAEEMENTRAEPRRFYAHSKKHADGSPAPLEEWEPLFTPFLGQSGPGCRKRDCPRCASLDPDHGHLNKVAFWTARFASEMFADPGDREKAWHWGYLAGLWHDLGKFAPKWQAYLDHTAGKDDIHSGEITRKVPHSTAGAAHAFSRKPLGSFLSYLIAGHHAGLADGHMLS